MSEAYVTPAGPLRAIVEGLVGAGVRDVVICPGSRSTPLALALRASAELRCWVHLDERAGAFFALGAAKASRRPAAILATSGTAVVNFAPAVTEAHYGRVPLVVLTADRPPELQGRGAPQTIDQERLYGRFAKSYDALPVPDASPGAKAQAHEVVVRAVTAATTTPAGPVHLNLPFREPLLPEGPLWDPAHAGALTAAEDSTAQPQSARTAPAPELGALVGYVTAARHGIIVCGPADIPGLPNALAQLARSTGFPILADGLSGMRSGRHDRSHVIAHADVLMRSATFRAGHAPDLVLRFGATPTSKAVNVAIEDQAASTFLVDDGHWDAELVWPLRVVRAEPVAFASALADAMTAAARSADLGWLEGWRNADQAAHGRMSDWLDANQEPFEGSVFAGLDAAVPDGPIVVVGNSMPVRDLDAFLPTSERVIRCLGNRGANGIDGLVSTALGAAAAQDAAVLAIVGDLSFLHDLNALVAAKRLGIDATIVLVNNDGGGIFSFLPQASAERPEVGLPAHFEELFGTPHGIDFGPLVQALGADHETLDPSQLKARIAASISRPGVQVLELRTERIRNVELHREVFAAAEQAIEAPA